MISTWLDFLTSPSDHTFLFVFKVHIFRMKLGEPKELCDTVVKVESDVKEEFDDEEFEEPRG